MQNILMNIKKFIASHIQHTYEFLIDTSGESKMNIGTVLFGLFFSITLYATSFIVERMFKNMCRILIIACMIGLLAILVIDTQRFQAIFSKEFVLGIKETTKKLFSFN